MKKLLLFIFLLIPLFSVSAIPTNLQNKVTQLDAFFLTSKIKSNNFIADVQSSSAHTQNQKTAKQLINRIKKTVSKINNTLDKLRERLTKIRQDPNFDANEAEINEIEDLIKSFKEKRTDIKGELKTVKDLRSDLPFKNNKTAKAIEYVNDAASYFESIEAELEDIIANGAVCSDQDFSAGINNAISDLQQATRKGKARLRQLFVRFDSNAEIKALTRALKQARKLKKKFKQAENEINKLSDTECNQIEISLDAGLGIVCTFFGEIQESGFGTATFTCEYPVGFNNAILELSAVNAESLETIDYGFASINFLGNGGSLRIDPCPTSLPVCTEAVPVVRSVELTSATLKVYAEGNLVATLVFQE